MSILQDAYLFKLEEFDAAVTPYLEALATSSNGYPQLCADAMQLYESIPRVQNLAIEYGSWDKASILKLFPVDHPESAEDTFFWLFLILYDAFKSNPGDLGLVSEWEFLNEILSRLGWQDQDRNLLIHGFSFSRFAQAWLLKHPLLEGRLEPSVEYWAEFHPYSTGGEAGWLDIENIDRLLGMLLKEEPRLVDLQEPLNTIEKIQRAYKSALDMLAAAQETGCDLCLIMSG